MKKYKFKLLSGTHTDTDGNFYSAVGLKEAKGDVLPVVTSERELDKVFKNHFKRIEVIDDEAVKPVAVKEVVTEDEPKPADTGNTDSEDDEDVDITLKPVRVARGQWDVVKVINGEVTEEVVNDEPLTRKKAYAVANDGYQGE